jgi:hypothetical protein
MIRYTSFNQLSIEEFKTPFEKEIDSTNRWVILSNSIPWDELAGIYHKAMNPNMGAPGKDARLVIGALIVKHKLGLSGEETIQIIRENPYIQYFLGCKEFTNNPVFDSGLFSSVLKRLGINTFNAMHAEIIEKALNIRLKSKKNGLIIAGIVSDQLTNHSANLKLLSDARIESEEIIDALCKAMNNCHKPRTYRIRAENEYVTASDEQPHTNKENRKAIGRQISFLKRNIKSVNKLLDLYADRREEEQLSDIKGFNPIPLNNSELKRFWIIQQVLDQQQKMYKSGKNNCPDRIIDIDHPHVRPVAKTKAKFKLLKTRIQLLQQVF